MKLYNSETGILPSMPKDFRVQISRSDTFQMFYPAWHTKPGSYSLAIDQQMQTKISWYSGSEHKRKPVSPSNLPEVPNSSHTHYVVTMYKNASGDLSHGLKNWGHKYVICIK